MLCKKCGKLQTHGSYCLYCGAATSKNISQRPPHLSPNSKSINNQADIEQPKINQENIEQAINNVPYVNNNKTEKKSGNPWKVGMIIVSIVLVFVIILVFLDMIMFKIKPTSVGNNINDIVIQGVKYYQTGDGLTAFGIEDKNQQNIVFDNRTTIINLPYIGNCSVENIFIPKSVQYINDYSFMGLEFLNSVEFEEGSKLTEISEGLFACCINLTSITIPNEVDVIKSNAFLGCGNLKTIYIPSSVNEIIADSYEQSPFRYCYDLEIYCEASVIQQNWSVYWNYYDSSDTLNVVYEVSLQEYNDYYKY